MSSTVLSPTQREPNAVFDVEGAAAKLDVSTWSVRELIRTRKLSAFRVGRLLRISQSAIDRFIEDSEGNAK
jgi:excisionase family DNA binding protein